EVPAPPGRHGPLPGRVARAVALRRPLASRRAPAAHHELVRYSPAGEEAPPVRHSRERGRLDVGRGRRRAAGRGGRRPALSLDNSPIGPYIWGSKVRPGREFVETSRGDPGASRGGHLI